MSSVSNQGLVRTSHAEHGNDKNVEHCGNGSGLYKFFHFSNSSIRSDRRNNTGSSILFTS